MKHYNIALENIAIQKKFHSFFYNRKRKTWIGELQPTTNSEIYTVKVVYNHQHDTKVFIIEPEILSFAPHRYSDLSLCLYHPNDNSFRSNTLIANTIIPWTSEWIYFYEIWLQEGVWWGEEASHSPRGK